MLPMLVPEPIILGIRKAIALLVDHQRSGFGEQYAVHL